MTMDFESLPGSHIYLPRQLELRWFYHWEVVNEAVDVSSSAASSDDNDAVVMTQHDVNHPFKGRLVRKQFHTMPFLQRNIAANTNYHYNTTSANGASVSRYIKRHRANVRGRPNKELMIAMQNGKYTAPSLGIAKDEKKLQREDQKCNGIGRKRKATAGEEDATTSNKRAHSGTNKSTKPPVVKKSAQENLNPKTQKHQTTQPLPSSSSDSFPSFAIYSQTPSIRTKLLQTIPKEFHGDETFILDKLREEWLLASRESKRLKGGNGEVESDDRCSDNAGNAEGSVNGSNSGSNSGKEDESKSMSTVKESRATTRRGSRQLNDERDEDVDPALPLAVTSDTNNKSVIPPLDMTMSSLQKLQNDDGTKQNCNRNLPPAYFHYLFMQRTNVLGSHVEEVEGRLCPLCNNIFDGKTNEGLLHHLGIDHGTLIKSPANSIQGVMAGEDGAYFESALGEEGQLHIIVRGVPLTPQLINQKKDFVFVQPRLLCRSSNNNAKKQHGHLNSNNIPYLQRQHHKTATLDPIIRNKKLLTLQSNDAPASAISAYLPTDSIPLRQYFHADTNLPMSNGSWDKDDSANVDETWRTNMSSELLEEFEDVTPKEKIFMKLWNGYIKRNHVLADRDMSAKCHDFVRVCCRELVQGELRLNLLLHLFNLWDNGVISEDRILACMEVFDGYVR